MPGECEAYTTSSAGTAHDWLTSDLGVFVLAALGLAGLFALVVAWRGSRWRVALLAGALFVGFLATSASTRVSSAMRCELPDSVDWSQQARAGAPAYFEITDSEMGEASRSRLVEAVDLLFWTGVIAFALAAARRL